MLEANNIIQITDENGTRTVDLSPVREYVHILEDSFKGKYPLMNTGSKEVLALYDLAKSMSHEQLLYLVNELDHRLANFARITRFLQTKEGLKSTCFLRKLVKKSDKSGNPLWEDNNELRQ